MVSGGGWRVPPYEIAPAAHQLARTEALWQEVAARQSAATIRWYGYPASTALVLGVGQSENDLDLAAARDAQVEVVKRTSGGTTVLANRHLIALDVALPSESLVGDVVESYRWVGQAFLGALRQLAPQHLDRIQLVQPLEARADQAAQRAAPVGTPESRRALACFGVLSPYEVALVADDRPPRKLIGLSQIRKRGVILYQAGVYVRFAGADLAPYLGIPADELDRRIGSLAELDLDDPQAVIAAVTEAIAAAVPEA